MKALLLFFFLLPASAVSQNLVQVELQNYKSGVTPGFRYDLKIGDNSYLTSKFGAYLSARKRVDIVHHKQEKGFVYSLGYAKTNFFTKNLTAHLRANLWQISTDRYYRYSVFSMPISGPERVYTELENTTFVQPTIGLEYGFGLGDNLFLKPQFSVGYSIEAKFSGNHSRVGFDRSDSRNHDPNEGTRLFGDAFVLNFGLSFGYGF